MSGGSMARGVLSPCYVLCTLDLLLILPPPIESPLKFHRLVGAVGVAMAAAVGEEVGVANHLTGRVGAIFHHSPSPLPPRPAVAAAAVAAAVGIESATASNHSSPTPSSSRPCRWISLPVVEGGPTRPPPPAVGVALGLLRETERSLPRLPPPPLHPAGAESWGLGGVPYRQVTRFTYPRGRSRPW